MENIGLWILFYLFMTIISCMFARLFYLVFEACISRTSNGEYSKLSLSPPPYSFE